MGWLTPSLVVCAWAALATAKVTVADLKCNHPECVDDGYDLDTNMHSFVVQGHKIYVTYADEYPFDMNCENWQALDSPATPSFTSEISVTSVKLNACPLPTNRSLVEALAAMNVRLQSDSDIKLDLTDLPVEPQLTPSYFSGFEKLTLIWLTATPPQIPSPDFNFLAKLPNLRSLNLGSIPLPVDVVLPPKLSSLSLVTTKVPPLLHLLRMSSNLRSLTLRYNEVVPSNVVPKETNSPSTLEEIVLIKWKEQRLVPLEKCESLRKLGFSLPTMEELPNRWVAACPHLETIEIDGAENLLSVPPKLLEGATALKILTIRVGLLTTLPDGFLEGAPNLKVLDISANNFRTLSSAVFAGPALETLLVGRNELENLDGIGSLSSLTGLNVEYNQLGNLCEKGGYSSLKDLTQLVHLSFTGENITHTCRDWRENMKFLTHLYLEHTQISELGFSDLVYTRDASVKNVTLFLKETPFNAIRFTEDDYKKAIATPIETTVLLNTRADLKCDCDMYWTWKALVSVNNTHWVNIRCPDLIPLQLKPLIEICPERAQE